MKNRFVISLLLVLFTVIGFSQTIQRIEAEAFDEASGAKAEANASLSGTGNVGYIKNNTWIKFSNHEFSKNDSRFDVAASGTAGGTIEFRLDAVDGTLIGEAIVNGTSGWTDFKIVSATITQTNGIRDLYMVFKGGSGYLFNLDYFEKVTSDSSAVYYTLTTNVSPTSSGTVKSNMSGTKFPEGTEITLTAQDNFGYDFVRWVDGNSTVISTENPMTFTITSDMTFIAEFQAINTYTLSVNVEGAFGLGDYIISPTGKDGAFSQYEKGTIVTITAIENDIIKFNNWSNGSTMLTTTVIMNENIAITGTYDNETFIAGWTFKEDRYNHPRVAELYANVENRPELFGYSIDSHTIAPNVRTNERGGKTGFSVWNSNRGAFFYFMTSFATIGYENINISSGLMGYYYGCDEWVFQYSLDGVNFIDVSSLTTINTNAITTIGGVLPKDAEGKKKVYIRWYPNVEGKKHGSAADVTGTLLSNIVVKANEVHIEETTSPVLQSIFPADASTSASASGNIVLTYDEKVIIGTKQATLNGEILTPEFVNRTVKYSYYGLKYNTIYTFNLPEGAITDLFGNPSEAVAITFKTIEKPIPTKKGFDLIVDVNATDEEVASGKYVRTIAEAFTAAPSNSSTRFLVLITNGTYNLGGDGISPQGIVLQLPSGKNNVSLIAQSKDKVIFQGNPAQGLKNAVLSIEANNLYMENITIEHSDGVINSGQKPALNPAGDRNVYNGIKLRSKQDTQVTGGHRSFYYQSTIEGDVDFICGSGTHWFEACHLNVVSGGYIVAPAHDTTVGYGYVFNNSTITAASTYYLGRPWQNAPRAVYLNTVMINEPHAVGWTSMGTLPAVFAEYNSVNAYGISINTDNRTNVFTVSGVQQTGNYNPVLTEEEAAAYTIENVLGGTDVWNPLLIVEKIEAPVNLSVNEYNTISWNENPYAICYVVSRNNQIVAVTTETAFTETTLTAGTHEYTVQAANEYGGLSSVSTISITTEGEQAVTASISYINTIDGTELANLTPNEYTEGTTLTLPTPSLDGYTFFGWSTSVTEPNSIKEISSITKGAQVFYAFWGVAGNNQPDTIIPPTKFDYVFTAAQNKSWDVSANFDPVAMPVAGKQVSCTKEIETTATVFPADITFTGAGTLRLRGAHKATGNLIFKEGTRVYYYTGGLGMSIEAPMIVTGNVKYEMQSSIADQTMMTLSGPISGNGNIICMNTGQGTVANTGILMLKGDNSEFTGTWDLTQKNINNPSLNYINVIEGASANAFGSGTINVDKGNYVVFSHERATGTDLNLNLAGNGKAVLNTVLNVQKMTINGVEYTSGTFDKTTNPEFFDGNGKVEITGDYNGGGNEEDIPAFPGAEGHGKYVTGGRGGRVIYVTNLNDNGPGSLRHAVSQSGPRIVMFKVSGTIKLESELSITDNITIAGQTAPGGGITLRDYNVKVRGNNVILRYLRFRMGDAAKLEEDAIGGRFQENIIIDHCSMSWSTDECVSFYENKNFTLQWCVISESLKNSVHDKGAHGYGGIWGGLKASFHHNLLAHHDSRNPRLGEYGGRTIPLEGLLDIRNNVIYNWGGNSCYGGDAMNVNMVNNYWKPGPGTSNSTKERILSTGRNLDETSPMYEIWGKFYIDGNYVDGSTRASQDNWTYGVYNQFHGSQLPVNEADKQEMKIETPHNPGEITTHSATKAYDLVLKYAGASIYRDEVDQRAVNDTRSGKATIMNGGNGSTNGFIDTPLAAGGWPELPTVEAPVDTDEDGMPDAWEIKNGLNPTNSIDGNLKTIDGIYTNIEVYINSLVTTITDNQNGSLEVYVTPENFMEKYAVAENGSKFIMAEGTYTVGEVAIKNHSYSFVPDGDAKPVFASYFYTENPQITSASFLFDGVDLDLTNSNSNFIQFKNGTGLSSLEIRNATIKGIKQSLLLTEGESAYPISKISITNCIIDGSSTQGYSFIKPDARVVNSIAVTNSTIYNYENGQNFIWLQNKDSENQTITLEFENNTIYNACKPEGNGFVRIDNAYNGTSKFTFRNNIMLDQRANESQVLLFNASSNEGLGLAILDNNLIVGASSHMVSGAVSVSITNEVTLASLGLNKLVFPNPSAGEFSFSVNSPLATAASDNSVLGDPRWLKKAAVLSLITYYNAIDGEKINELSPTHYIEGITQVLPIPTLEAYTFFGWSSSSTVPDLIKEIPSNSKGNKMFYAFWGNGGNNHSDSGVPVNYSISYLNLPIRAINPNINTIKVGSSYKLVDAICAGYRFMGWFTDADYITEIDSLDSSHTKSITLYSRWKKLGEFYAFPTVATNLVTLKSSEKNDAIMITNSLGVIIKQLITTSMQTSIELGGLEAGVYFIKSLKTGMITKIIVK